MHVGNLRPRKRDRKIDLPGWLGSLQVMRDAFGCKCETLGNSETWSVYSSWAQRKILKTRARCEKDMSRKKGRGRTKEGRWTAIRRKYKEKERIPNPPNQLSTVVTMQGFPSPRGLTDWEPGRPSHCSCRQGFTLRFALRGPARRESRLPFPVACMQDRAWP